MRYEVFTVFEGTREWSAGTDFFEAADDFGTLVARAEGGTRSPAEPVRLVSSDFGTLREWRAGVYSTPVATAEGSF